MPAGCGALAAAPWDGRDGAHLQAATGASGAGASEGGGTPGAAADTATASVSVTDAATACSGTARRRRLVASVDPGRSARCSAPGVVLARDAGPTATDPDSDSASATACDSASGSDDRGGAAAGGRGPAARQAGAPRVSHSAAIGSPAGSESGAPSEALRKLRAIMLRIGSQLS